MQLNSLPPRASSPRQDVLQLEKGVLLYFGCAQKELAVENETVHHKKVGLIANIQEGIISLYIFATNEALLSYILDMMHEQKH